MYHHLYRLFDMLQDFQSTDVLPERELEIKKQEFADYQKSKEGNNNLLSFIIYIYLLIIIQFFKYNI